MFAKRIRHRQQGLTLIELAIAIVVVLVGILGVLSALRIMTRDSVNPMLIKQQIAIAQSLMEEIQSKLFTFCDPSDEAVTTIPVGGTCNVAQQMGPGGNPVRVRTNQLNPFRHVADFNGLNMTGILDPGDGTAIAGLGNYTATVAIAQVGNTLGVRDGSVIGAGADQASAVLRITVTVAVPGQTPLILTGYRYRYAPNFVY